MKKFVAIVCAAGQLALWGCGTDQPAERVSDVRVEEPPACTAVEPPKPRALAEEELARAVADAWIERHPPETMHWDWGPAVLSYGMLDLYEATGDNKYRRYVEAWQRHHAGKFPMIWSDTVAPASAAARLASWSCDEALLHTVAQTRAYLETAPTTEAGGIGHLGLLQEELPQLWVDSLFMFGSFLMARGELFDEPADWDLYAEQILIFAEELQDTSGLFRHALVHEKPFPASPVFWGRGNGWVASILSRFLTLLPETHPHYERIADVERKLLAGVLETQDEASGMWWTVVNHPGKGYLETSATALFGDALLRGAKLGLVDKKAAVAAYEAALEAVRQQVEDIDDLATVRGTSGPTQPGGLDYYAGLPVDDDIHYGVGAVLLLLTAK